MTWFLAWLKPYIEWALLVFFGMFVWSWMLQAFFDRVRELGSFLLAMYFDNLRQVTKEATDRAFRMSDMMDKGSQSSGPKM